MKFCKKLKGLGKGLKFGLAGAAFYAATLAMPVHAEAKQEQIIQPVKLEQITTVEQAKNFYNKKLEEYCVDKKLEVREIKDLYEIVTKGHSLEAEARAETQKALQGQYGDLVGQVKDLESKKRKLPLPLKGLEEKIGLETKKLNSINVNIEKEAKYKSILVNHKKELKKILKELDNVFPTYYPGLLQGTNSEYNNLQYFARDKIVGNLKEIVYPLIEKADMIFRRAYQKEDINQVLHSNLKLQDIIIFREIIKSSNKLKYVPKNYKALKEEKLKLIKHLKQKKVLLGEKLSPKLKSVDEEINELRQEIANIKGKKWEKSVFKARKLRFKPYFSAIKKREEVIKSNNGLDAGEYWAESLMLKNEIGKMNDQKYNFNPEVLSLESLLEQEGFNVDVEDVKNPTSTKLPLWLTWFGGIAITLLRKLLIPKYVIKREYDISDFIVEPLLMATFISPFFIDAIHPLAYPIRLFGTPFIEEPMRKIFGWSTPR